MKGVKTMNQQILEEVIKRVAFEIMNSQQVNRIEIEEVEIEESCPECDYIDALENEIESLKSENSDLKEELAERTIDDLYREIDELRQNQNDLIGSFIDLLDLLEESCP